ncbi:MAG TPA: hypothetical protein VF190_04740, partial [Rhodothermales bacterium]
MNEGLQLGLGGGIENPFQHQQVEVLVPQRERQVIRVGHPRPVALVEHHPPGLLATVTENVPVRHASRAAHRRCYSEPFYELGPACQPGSAWDCALLKNGHGIEIRSPTSKTTRFRDRTSKTILSRTIEKRPTSIENNARKCLLIEKRPTLAPELRAAFVRAEVHDLSPDLLPDAG